MFCIIQSLQDDPFKRRNLLTSAICFKYDLDESKQRLVVTYCTLWAVNDLDLRLND